MDARQIWTNLERIFHMSARELYDNEEMEDLQRTCNRAVEQMSKSEKRTSLSLYVREVMLSDEALARGDGWEPVLSFLDWVDGGMD